MKILAEMTFTSSQQEIIIFVVLSPMARSTGIYSHVVELFRPIDFMFYYWRWNCTSSS